MNDNTTLQKVIALLEETLETLNLPGNHPDTVWHEHGITMADHLEYILGVARGESPQEASQVPLYLPGEPWAISKVLDKEVPATSPDWQIWKDFAELVPVSEIAGSFRKVIGVDGVPRVIPTEVRVQVGWFLLSFDQRLFLFNVPLSSAFAEDYTNKFALLGWIADAPLLCKKQLVGSVEAYDEMRCHMERHNKTLGVSVTLLPEITSMFNDLSPTHVL